MVLNLLFGFICLLWFYLIELYLKAKRNKNEKAESLLYKVMGATGVIGFVVFILAVIQ